MFNGNYQLELLDEGGDVGIRGTAKITPSEKGGGALPVVRGNNNVEMLDDNYEVEDLGDLEMFDKNYDVEMLRSPERLANDCRR